MTLAPLTARVFNWHANRYNEATDKVAPRLIPTQDQRDSVLIVVVLVVVLVVLLVVLLVLVLVLVLVVVPVPVLVMVLVMVDDDDMPDTVQVKLALHSMTVGDDEPMCFVPSSLYAPNT